MSPDEITECQELSFRLIKDNPYKAMDYLDYDEDNVQALFEALNGELNGELSTQYSRINW